MINSALTQERLHELLDYNPKTGVFRWKVNRRFTATTGSIAGVTDSHGHRQITIDWKKYLAHRLIWLCVYGSWPIEQIDHINGIRDDNRLSNLRECTRSQNHANRRKFRCNGLKGASFHKCSGRWAAQIGKNGKVIHLGLFNSELEAHNAYMAAAKQLHGEFARAA
jgi:hypothetical protein